MSNHYISRSMNVQKNIPMHYIYAYTTCSFILYQKQIKLGGLKRETRKVGHKKRLN